jgi:AraC-like DNA-binding protein
VNSTRVAQLLGLPHHNSFIRASPLVRISRPRPCDLSYLSWGRRYYGDPPIEPTGHEGWHYFLALGGKASLVIDGQTVSAEPGLISIGHPECLIGHFDEGERVSEMLTWVWRSPPTHPTLCPAPGKAKLLHLDVGRVRRVQRIHAQCREAIAHSNERSLLQLKAYRLLIDVCLLEALEHLPVAETDLRFELAVEYFRNHVGERQSISGLCDYLQISKASLYRLFAERCGKGPHAYAQGLKMEWAREQLASVGRSVKSVAFALGYRHSPDFSRAFKQHFGVPASCAARIEVPAPNAA